MCSMNKIILSFFTVFFTLLSGASVFADSDLNVPIIDISTDDIINKTIEQADSDFIDGITKQQEGQLNTLENEVLGPEVSEVVVTT